MSYFKTIAPALFQAGYEVIPSGSKKIPTVDEWQKVNVTEAQVTYWANNGQANNNVSIRTGTGPSPIAMADFDFYDEVVHNKVRASFEARFGTGPVRVGQAPKSGVIYALAHSCEKIQASWKSPDHAEVQKFEFLAKGQQFVAYGWHDKANKEYDWPNESLLDVEPWMLTVVSPEDVLDWVNNDLIYLVPENWDFVHSTAAPKEKKAYCADTFFARVNVLAMASFASWVPHLFPNAEPYNSGYRVDSKYLNRDLEESISIVAEGIKDWGVHDMGDPHEGKRTPIMLVAEWHDATPKLNEIKAAHWLCRKMNVTAEGLGYEGPEVVFGNEMDDLDEDNEPYPDPRDLWEKPIPPAFTNDLLPDLITGFAVEKAAIAGHDPKGYAMAAFGACAAAIPLHVTIKPNRKATDWETPIITWVAIVGNASAGKTPILKTSLKATTAYNAKLMESHSFAMATWEQDCASVQKGQPKPDKPKAKRRMVQDATIEKVGAIMEEDGTGLTLFYDELSGFLNSIGQYKNNGGGDKAQWLSAWNGDSIVIDRIGRGTLYVPHWGPSIIGGIQPSKLKEAIKDSVEDGMLPRYLVAVMHDSHRLDEGSCEDGDGSITAMFNRAVTAILKMRPVSLSFSFEAQARFSEMEKQARRDGETMLGIQPAVGYHMMKWGTLLARAAAAIHVIKWASEYEEFMSDEVSPVIDLDTLEMAIRFLKWEFGQQWALYNSMAGVSPAIDLARRVGLVILAKGLTRPERRDFQRYLASQWEAAGPAVQKEAVQLLFDYGWLTKDISRSKYGRRSPSYGDGTKWVTNPKVFDLFHDIGQVESHRRKALADAWQEKVTANVAEKGYD